MIFTASDSLIIFSVLPVTIEDPAINIPDVVAPIVLPVIVK